MDGVRDVLDLLGRGDVFEALKGLRDGLAHGNISLNDAISTAKANLELVRRAFLLMILRILGVEDSVVESILSKPGYKGSSTPFVKFFATIRFQPGDIIALDAHPLVDLRCSVKVCRQGDSLTVQPTWQLTPKNVDMRVRGHELWGDLAGRPETCASETMVTRAENQK